MAIPDAPPLSPPVNDADGVTTKDRMEARLIKPTHGVMEQYIASIVSSAGGRTMKPGGKSGFLYTSGPYKGMTLEQVTDTARQQWVNLGDEGRTAWEQKNIGNYRTASEKAAMNKSGQTQSAENSSEAPFGLNSPKFNGGQKYGRDGKPWGLGDQPAPTSSVARGGNSAPATPSEEAMLQSVLPKPTFAVRNNTQSGPPAPGQVAKTIDGQYGSGSVTFGQPAPTARTGRIFDNGKDVTGQVVDSLNSRQVAPTMVKAPPAQPNIPPSKYPSPVDSASDAAMKGLIKPLMEPKAAPTYSTPPLTSAPDPRTHSPVSPFGAGAPPITPKPSVIGQAMPEGVPAEQKMKTAPQWPPQSYLDSIAAEKAQKAKLTAAR